MENENSDLNKTSRDISIELTDQALYSIYNEYSTLLSGIFYYQYQQIDLRVIAIKIVLGTFAIVGGLIYCDIGLTSSYLLTIISILPFLSIIAIIVTLFNDLIYREGLKVGFFGEAVNFETKHSWLPAFHRCLITETDLHHHPGSNQVTFYYGSIFLLSLISLFGIGFLPIFKGIFPKTCLVVGFCIIAFFFRFFVNKVLFRINHILEKLRYFDKVEATGETNNSIASIFISLIHSRGKEYIEHFSSIKMTYKKLVLLIVTALFVSLSYLAAVKEEYVHINKIYLIAFLTILSIAGINLVRYLDINVSHKQIRLIFDLMIHLEEKYPFLSKPYVKVKNILYQNNFDPAVLDFSFYAAISFGFICFGSLVLISKIQAHHPVFSICIGLGIILIFFFWEIFSYIKVGKLQFSKKDN